MKKMRIPITDNIIMTSDTANFILNREKIADKGKNKGRKVLEPFAYYPNVVQALSGCANLKLRESTAKSLKSLLIEHTAFLRHCRELFDTQVQPK